MGEEVLVIRTVEALRFRSLRHVRQSIDPFQVLVGPNATGKTTFLDVVAFFSRVVSAGLEVAIEERTSNFADLLWRREGESFEIALEVEVDGRLVRYEISVGQTDNSWSISRERVFLLPDAPRPSEGLVQHGLFPRDLVPPDSILHTSARPGRRMILSRQPDGSSNFYSEVDEPGGDWLVNFRLGTRRSTLATLPDDVTKFPTAIRLKELLTEGVQTLQLNSLLIRRPSAPGQGRRFRPDGSNLPWVVHGLEKESPDTLQRWIEHLQTALPDLSGVRTVERPEDRHRYLMLRYSSGVEVPSWMASDGTLRLLALTITPYLSDFSGIYLVEEPENGVHPRAVETLFQSLSSVYGAQMLLATHSPIVLSIAEARQILCFAKGPSGATDIVRGDQHPQLQDWRGSPNLGVMFAGGVLG